MSNLTVCNSLTDYPQDVEVRWGKRQRKIITTNGCPEYQYVEALQPDLPGLWEIEIRPGENSASSDIYWKLTVETSDKCIFHPGMSYVSNTSTNGKVTIWRLQGWSIDWRLVIEYEGDISLSQPTNVTIGDED